MVKMLDSFTIFIKKTKEVAKSGHLHRAGGIPITDTVPLISLVTYILLLVGLYTISHGAIPTVTVSTIVLFASTTDTVLEYGSPP
jgi:uncharacterized membrane protein